MVLFYSGHVFGGEFEDTLKKAEQEDDKIPPGWTRVIEHDSDGQVIDHQKIFNQRKKLAEEGNASNQCFLGRSYYKGEGVTQNYKKAAYWYEKAAEQEDAWAQFFLGSMYQNGEGTTQDNKKAIYWYKKAAEKEHIGAQLFLGMFYRGGMGVPLDYTKAVYWYKKAAEQGDVLAQNNLAIMYANGEGVTQDYKQAVYWYKKSAEQGYAGAQYNLGNMYYNGQGTTQNYKLAYVWESLAAAQGHESATKNRNITAKKLTPQQLSQAQELAATIQYKIDHPSKSQKQQPSISNTEKKINGSGTGFIITRDGYILTCYHVIKDANEIKISTGGNIYSAKLIRKDANNDLALLKINGSFQAIAFSSKRSARMGQEVFTIGYPNPSLQGVSAKFTKGTINSLTGFQDDLRLYQVSVPVQPGNSGGALVDNNGNILGVIMAMLSAKTAFKISGSLPQNVNYAVKGTYAQAILDTLPEISNKLPNPSKTKSNAVERVKASTVMVLSYE